MKFLLWLMSVLGLISGTSSSNNTDGCQKCICKTLNETRRYTVICDGSISGTKLTKIPKIPNKTEELVFINNELTNLTKATMPDMAHIRLTHLNLTNNSISYIDETTFGSLQYLKVLDLSQNTNLSTRNACRSFQTISRTLQSLMLNHMLWNSSNDMHCMFNGLQNSNISHVELSHSYLYPFNGSWFQELPTLTYLDISWNAIQDRQLTFEGLTSLTLLSLVGNYFNYVPNFCEPELKNLVTLWISNTRLGSLAEFRHHTRCLVKLEVLNINGISVPLIPTNTFSELPSLKRLSLVRMSTQLKRIYPYAFNSSSITSLSFSKCDGFYFTRESLKTEYITPDIFNQSENLTEINLSHNFVQFDVEEIKAIFYPLQKLQRMILTAMDLANIPTNFFGRFSQLENIVLDKNRILGWSDGGDIFRDVNKLRFLSLRNNKISYLTQTSFPDYVLLTLRHLDLSNNRFTCTCDLLWFSHWIIETTIDLGNKSTYICDNGTPLLDYHPTYIDCSHFIFIITVSVCGGFSCITISIVIIYCCRWRIRFLLYKLRSRSQYRKILDEDGFRYIAYVIYCYNDLGWVKDNLIPNIEVELGLKLCIPHRDFELGSVFADDIVDHMNSSKTVIPILSNDFAKDEWCLFQLAVARCKLSKEGTFSILPILLEEIKFKNMNAAIYTMMNMTSYATWNSDENAQELFWDKVKYNVMSLNY